MAKATSSPTLAEMLAEPPLFKSIEYPLTISGIAFGGAPLRTSRKSGRLVRVRPCDREETFLGIMLGDFPLSMSAIHDRDSGVLSFRIGQHNPAMWVPSLSKIVFGCQSWWSTIEKPEDLKSITDERIHDTWYVKLAEQMSSGSGAGAASSAEQPRGGPS